MKIEPDPYHSAQLNSYYKEERSGIWWVAVIIIGVFIGNLFSFGAYQLYVRWELKQLSMLLRTEAAEQVNRSNVEIGRLAKKNEALRREREKQNGVNAKLLQTCEFWRQQVAKENTSQNRVYRDAACSRATRAVR